MPHARAPSFLGAGAGSRAWARASDIVMLSKPRITGMVLVVTVFGYLMARQHPLRWSALALTMLGTLLVGAGGNALNQYLERHSDKLMRRTRGRPLPAGRMNPSAVLVGGAGAVLVGIAVLALGAHPLAALVALVVVITYVLCYTPLKVRSGLNTLVGAVPGALPPVLGWAAAAGTVDQGALALFLILFVWQLPHFLAIATLYRDEYAAASMPMLTVIDPDGSRTRRQMVLYATVLIPVSLYPAVVGMAGHFYFYSALIVGILYLVTNLALAIAPSLVTARVALRASLIYLPLLFTLMYLNEPSL
jgi:protoheme IX farnesyltransferase